MQTNPSHFIEQVKYYDGDIRSFSPQPIRILEWSIIASRKLNVETIAIFKIYPKIKPAIAHYDYDLKTTIVE